MTDISTADFDRMNPHWPGAPAWFTDAATPVVEAWLRGMLDDCGHEEAPVFIDAQQHRATCGPCMASHVAHQIVLRNAPDTTALRAFTGRTCPACGNPATRLPFTQHPRLTRVLVTLGTCDEHGPAES